MSSQSENQSSEDLVQIFVEQMEDRFSLLQEGLEAIIERKLLPIRADLQVLKKDMDFMKVLYDDHSATLNNHEGRITALEQ